ncbi:MAG: SLOG family protein [Candidatus Coproplasma sp.]
MAFENVCAFSGNRDLSADFSQEKLEKAVKNTIEDGVDTFLCGMARGFDLIAGQTVLRLKTEYPHIKLIACIPCLYQDKYFNEQDKKLYLETLSLCDDKVYVSKSYFKGCMLVRNRYMVDNSSRLIAFERQSDGGTVYTVKYALSKNKKVYIL